MNYCYYLHQRYHPQPAQHPYYRHETFIGIIFDLDKIFTLRNEKKNHFLRIIRFLQYLCSLKAHGKPPKAYFFNYFLYIHFLMYK